MKGKRKIGTGGKAGKKSSARRSGRTGPARVKKTAAKPGKAPLRAPARGPRRKTGGGRKRVIGGFIGHERGFGFVAVEGGGPDVFIPPGDRHDAMHGDRVEVLVGAPDRQGRLSGEVVKVLERGNAPMVGVFDGRMVTPRDGRFDSVVRIHHADMGDAEPGDTVVVEVSRWPSPHRAAAGRIVEVLGQDGDPGLESRVSLTSHGFTEEFPDDVLREVEAVPAEVRAEDRACREDLRERFTITIDPDRARDFDDALSVESRPQGYRVWVSIADVSHYVRTGSPLDLEAYERATSVYLPDRSVPMLPHELSSGICSLKPHLERLAMTVEMDFDQTGKRRNARYYASVIQSDHRLTYDQVEQMAHDPKLRREFPGAWEAVALLDELAGKRRKLRLARGMVDLDMAEAEVVLDAEGEVATILRREQTWSHRLVEEFMLSANEAVAEFMTERNQPMVYRIHEPPLPAAVNALADFLAPLGIALFGKGAQPEHIKPRDFQRVIHQARGGPYEAMVKMVCLRSMMQARYSAELRGHFGLASDRYCHFTSPIRRYPDLMVHRLLKQLLGLPQTGRAAPAPLPTAALHASERERAAELVERELTDLQRARWMSRHIGEEFEGTVSGAAGHGFYVELDEAFVEGLVPLDTLGPDAFFVEKELAVSAGRKKYRLGDRVRVEAASVDLVKRRINFWLLDKSPGAQGNK